MTRTARHPTLLLLLVAATGLACGIDSPTGLTPTSLWETVLGPEGPELPGATITGRAAVVVRSSGMDVGIRLDGIDDDMELRWGLFRGGCAAPGDLIAMPASYPILSAAAPEAEIWIGARLTKDESYHVAVSRLEDDARLACGDLSLIE